MGFFDKLYGKTSSLFRDIRRQYVKGINKFKLNKHVKPYMKEAALPYARISQQAYEPVDKRHDVGPFKYMRSISTPAIAVYADHPSRHMIVGFRGTAQGKDIVPDIHIALGTQRGSTRFQSDARFFEKLKKQYPTYRIEVTGHSLGGAIANHVADKHRGTRGYTFNAGRGFDLEHGLRSIFRKHNKLKNIRSKGDLVSLLNLPSSTTIQANDNDPHAIDNFL